jgi:hypothetical protein
MAETILSGQVTHRTDMSEIDQLFRMADGPARRTVRTTGVVTAI